jgi:mRNA interferase MazF
VQAQALLSAGHPSTLVVPLTTNVIDDAQPLRLLVPSSARLPRALDLLVDQLRAIDNRRLVKGPVARTDAEFMRAVGEAICEVLDIA